MSCCVLRAAARQAAAGKTLLLGLNTVRIRWIPSPPANDMFDHGRPFTTFAGDRLGGPANTAIKKLFGSCDSCCGILVVDHDVLKRLHGFGRSLQSQRLNIRRGMIRRAFSSPRSRNSLMTNGEWHTVSHRFPIWQAPLPRKLAGNCYGRKRERCGQQCRR